MGIGIASAFKNGMMLKLNRVTAFIIRIKPIKVLRSKAWVDDPNAAHGVCSIGTVQVLAAAYLYVQPMKSCPELGNDLSEVPIPSLLNVWLASPAKYDAAVQYALAKGLQAQLLHMLMLGRFKRKPLELWRVLRWTWDQVVL